MNIFHKVARESLSKNRTRTLVTVIGVVLSAALITGVMSFGYSLLRTLAEATAVRYGDWHLAVESADEAFMSEQEQSGAVADIFAFDELGDIVINDEDSKVRLIGFTKEMFSRLPLTVISGRLPQNERELLLRDGVSERTTGDTVSVSFGDGTQVQYTVVGICSRPAFESKNSDGYIAITYIEEMSGTALKTAFIKLSNPYSIRSYASGIAENSYYNSKLLRFMGIWESGDDSIMVTMMLAVGIVVIGIIMIGSVFLIFNSFNISLNERTHQIGLLASVGATPKQILGSVLYEGLCVGVIGIPLGILAGLGAMQLVISTTASQFSDIFPMAIGLRLYVSLPILLGAMLISLVTILISAYIPARKAAGTPVMSCIRQTGEVKLSGRDVKTSKLSEQLLGFEGTLALKNFKRNRRQYRSVILSLVLSIVLFVSTSTFTESLSAIADNSRMVTDYDVGFGATKIDDDTLITLFEKCSTLNYMTGRSMQAVYEIPIAVDDTSYTATVQFLDNESYTDYLERCGIDAATDRLPALAKTNDSSADSVEQLPNLFESKSVMAVLNEKEINIECVEVISPDVPPFRGTVKTLPYTLQIVAPWSMKQELAPDSEPRAKGITVCSDRSDEDKKQLQSIVAADGISGSYYLVDCAEILNSNNSLVSVANLFSYTFIVMITLIAVANVFNTISTNIRLRRRELAMIRSVGMSDRSFNRMMRFECVFYGLCAMLFGLPLSLLLSYGIQGVMMDGVVEAGGASYSFPGIPIAVSICGVLLIIFVTMMYTVNKLKRENIIDALRDEMN